MPVLYGFSRRTAAAYFLTFIIGSVTFLFFDKMLNKKGELIFKLCWALSLLCLFVWDFWKIPFLFWLMALMYTVYFLYLAIVIFKQRQTNKQ